MASSLDYFQNSTQEKSVVVLIAVKDDVLLVDLSLESEVSILYFNLITKGYRIIESRYFEPLEEAQNCKLDARNWSKDTLDEYLLANAA